MVTSVVANDGWTLAIEIRRASDPKGVVLMTHAMMVDRRTLDRPKGEGLASVLLAAGWTVMLADFRGHGESQPHASRGVNWSYDDLVFRDAPALMDAAATEAGTRPFVLLGHSLGTHVCSASVGSGSVTRPPDAWVLFAPNIWLPRLEPSRRRRLLKGAVGRALKAVSFARGYFPSRRFRMGPANESRRYMADFRRFWREDRWASADGRDFLAAIETIRAPSLVIVGTADALYSPMSDVRRFLGSWGGSVTWWHVGGDEVGFEPGHMEVVTDARCLPMWTRVVGWLEENT